MMGVECQRNFKTCIECAMTETSRFAQVRQHHVKLLQADNGFSGEALRATGRGPVSIKM
jgi:hypothetical protein